DSGLLSEEQLNHEVRLWRQAARKVAEEQGLLPDECRRYFIIRCITDLQVKDVVTTSEKLIGAAGVSSADDVRGQTQPLVQYSALRRKLNFELRDFLYDN